MTLALVPMKDLGRRSNAFQPCSMSPSAWGWSMQCCVMSSRPYAPQQMSTVPSSRMIGVIWILASISSRKR